MLLLSEPGIGFVTPVPVSLKTRRKQKHSPSLLWNRDIVQWHRVDITIIILDTELVSDFVLHGYCFSITVNGPVLMLPHRANKSLTHENCAPQSKFIYDHENEIFFLISSEILKSGRFVYFIYRTKALK